MDFFPFTVQGSDDSGGVNWGFRKLLVDNKPEKLVWYTADVVIKSPTEVTFIVYDMLDMCYGGRGKQIAQFDAVTTLEVTRAAIERRASQVAYYKRAKELSDHESAIITQYTNEFLNTVLGETT